MVPAVKGNALSGLRLGGVLLERSASPSSSGILYKMGGRETHVSS